MKFKRIVFVKIDKDTIWTFSGPSEPTYRYSHPLHIVHVNPLHMPDKVSHVLLVLTFTFMYGIIQT